MTLRNYKTKTQCRSQWRTNLFTHLEPLTPGTTLLQTSTPEALCCNANSGALSSGVQNKLRHHNVLCVSNYVFLLTLTFPSLPLSWLHPSSPQLVSTCCPGLIPLILTYLMKCLKLLCGNPSIPITRTHNAQTHIKRQGFLLFPSFNGWLLLHFPECPFLPMCVLLVLIEDGFVSSSGQIWRKCIFTSPMDPLQ